VFDHNFFELLSPLLKILGNCHIQGCLALFFLCRGNLARCLLGCGEFSLWFGEGLDFRRGIPFGPGGTVSQWHGRCSRSRHCGIASLGMSELKQAIWGS
jgi:hypothetical protein